MNITLNVLHKLHNKYKVNYSEDYTTSQDVFNQAFRFIEHRLPGYFNWERIAEDLVINHELNSLLKQCLQLNHELKVLQFDALNAQLICLNFSQKFPDANQLKLASSPEEQGIQERFLLSQSTDDKSLSTLDIQRHIIQTNMTGHIGVVDINSDTMILFLAHAKTYSDHQRDLKPEHAFSTAMMVNYNPQAEAQWASVVLTIKPQNNEVHYEITSASDATKEQLEELTTKINNTIKFQATSPVTGLTVKAYPNSIIAPPVYNKIKEQNTYYLLHQLYNNEALTDIVREHENAQTFKSVDADLNVIQQTIYKQQIQAIKIEPALFTLFEAKAQPQHPMVSEIIQDVRISESKITFPRVKPSSPLAAQDYQLFILLLKQKFDSSEANKRLNTLEIKNTDLSAVQGLARLKGHLYNLPFDTLILELPQSLGTHDKPAFKFNLKLALISLSESNLSKMQINDPHGLLDEQDITEFTAFIEQYNCAIDCSLPNHFAQSIYQRRIDSAVSQAILNRNALNFLNQNPRTESASIARTIRTRPELASNNISIDVELQQEVQVEVAVDTAEQHKNIVNESEHEADLYTLQSYKKALLENTFSLESKSYLIPSGSAADTIWCNWLGYFDTIEADAGLQISKPALEELMRYSEQFQYGIGFLKQGDDYQNAPAGFNIKKRGDITYIDFDPQLKLLSIPNLLAVDTKEAQSDVLLSTSQIQKWLDTNPHHPFKAIWEELLTSDKYNKHTVRTLQCALPKIALFSFEQAKILFELCQTDTQVDVQKLNFLVNDVIKAKNILNLDKSQTSNLEHYLESIFPKQKEKMVDYIINCSLHTGDTQYSVFDSILNLEEKAYVDAIKSNSTAINNYALLQLYLQTGSHGLLKLNELLSKSGEKQELYQKIIKSISINNGSYQQLLSNEFEESLKIYFALPRNEQHFFFKLFEQHAHYNSNVDFAELVNSFIQFKQELQTLVKPGQLFSLPEQCDFNQVKSLPLALSRIVTLVRYVKQEDKQTQLLESHALDLSSTGMIQAITRITNYMKRWNFITKEMQLTQQHEQGCYKAQNDWRDLSGSGANQAKEFFKYVSFQEKKKSFSLNYYKHVVQKIQQESLTHSWSEQSTLLFYKLIAASSTHDTTTNHANHTKKAIAEFDILFEKINVPPNPGGIAHRLTNPDNMRIKLLDTLTSLDSIPPSQVLSPLVTLISNSLSSIVHIVANVQALDKANASLKEMLHKYDNSIYKGMACYQRADYDNTQLFFEHMATIKAIYEESHLDNNDDWKKYSFGKLLIPLISTFHLKSDKKHPQKDNLNAVFNAVSTLEVGESLELLTILTHIEANKYSTLPPLYHVHLTALIDTIKTHQYSSVIKAIKYFKIGEQQLTAYFDPRYLHNYGKDEVPIEVKKKIEQGFDEPLRPAIEDILLNFTDKNDFYDYESVVDKLLSICNHLPKLEQHLFISKLNQTKGLYSNPTPLNKENNHFRQLLNVIEERNAPDELLNFIASSKTLYSKLGHENNQKNSNQELDTKALLFIKEIYPQIKYQKDLSFSLLEITPRLHEWLLRTPVVQLKEQSEVIHPDNQTTTNYLTKSQHFLDALNENTTLNWSDLKKVLFVLDNSSRFTNKERLQILQKKITSAQKSLSINLRDWWDMSKNPPTQQLFLYFSEKMTPEEKALFENRYKNFMESQITKHPALIKNKALIAVVLNEQNLSLLKNTTSGDSLAALKSPDLLTNESAFNTFLTGIEYDVNALAELNESIVQTHKEVEHYQHGLRYYPNVTLFLVDKLAAIVSENPIAHSRFLELFDTFVSHYDSSQGEMMLVLHHFADQIMSVFSMIEDKNVVLSLCMHFNEDEQLQPEDLLKLITTIKTVKHTEHQKLLLNIAIKLLNNSKGYTLSDGEGNNFTLLCQLAKDPLFISALHTFYEKPPYPDLKQMMTFHNTATKNTNYNQTINQLAKDFDKKPCHRELDINGFHIDNALKQIDLFQGYNTNPEELERFHQKTVAMREYSSRELLNLLNSVHPQNKNPNKDIETLVAVAAELFYRAQGKNAYNSEGNYKLGSSMEINTTQYLAILSLLKTPGHVTSQIGTGEGKSRIMMIANVCQWALGNTVDFVTSDVQLAARDYVEYQAYFNMAGAKTAIISAHSPSSSYQINGINFSDPSNLSLFRNKAKSLGNEAQVLSLDKKHRVLILDEADKTYFDVADTRFNFSKEGNTSIQEMSWIYPLLMAYFEQDSISVDKSIAQTGIISPQQLFYANADASRKHFIAFTASHCSKKEYARLNILSDNQIEQWQVSAVTASQLEFNKDFVIISDQLISTPKGPHISSEAHLLFANRVAKGSKFSFGVHQCLHARLNRLRLMPEKISNGRLKQALSQCEHPFYIADEKQIVYSSTSKNLIDDYKKGTVKAVTGTVGSLIEKAEAKKLYNTMHFIEVPRAKGLIRQDKGIQLGKNEKMQLDSLIVNINKAQINNQPILIITENDEESVRLYNLLQKHFSDDLQIINSQLSSKEEQIKTKNAGLPRMITVSTDMIGRGTDIELRKKTLQDGTVIDAQQHGLNVLVTYLPRIRDLEQIIGRSGRFGAQGETSLILDESHLLKKLGLNQLPADYIKNTNAFIAREQTKMDRKAQADRLLKNHIGDFRMTLQERFFDHMLTQVPNRAKKELVSCWTTCFEKSDKIWNEIWPHIQKQLQHNNITEIELNEIELLMNKYQQAAQKEWDVMLSKIQNLDIMSLNNDIKAHDLLQPNVPNLLLDDDIKELFICFKVSKHEPTQDNHLFKKILGGMLAFIGAALGIALIATGFLAPLGIGLILTVVIVTLGSGFTGGLIGVLSGSVIDHFFKPNPTEILEINLDNKSEKTPSSYASIMRKDQFKNEYLSSEVDEEKPPNVIESSTLENKEEPLEEEISTDAYNKGMPR